MAVATYQDVGVSLGRTITDADEQAQITHWLNGVELIITNRLSVAVGDLDQAVLVYVETEAVADKVRRGRGDGASSITVSVDDGSVTRRYETGMSAGDITADWWDMLNPLARGSAYTIGVSSPLDLA